MTMRDLWESFLLHFALDGIRNRLKRRKWRSWEPPCPEGFDIKDREIKLKNLSKSPPERQFMREFERVRQPEGEGKRRLFTNNIFSLYVWYTQYRTFLFIKDEKIVGFELIYGKDKSTSIRYEEGRNYKSHNRLIVDGSHYDMTTSYGAKRGRVSETILKRFHEDSAYIPDEVRRYVENALKTMR